MYGLTDSQVSVRRVSGRKDTEDKRMSEGPKPITIEEYRKRRKNQKQESEITIPVVKRPKRRGGVIQKLKREKAILLKLINVQPPPSWETSTKLWQQLNNIEFFIEQEKARRK